MQLIILGAVFVGTLSLIVGGYVFVNRRRLAAAAAARERLRQDEAAPVRGILRDASTSDLPFLNRLLSGGSLGDEISRLTQRAGSTMTPGMFLLASAATALIGLFLALLADAPMLAVATTAIGALLPTLWMRMRARRRLATFESQLPDAIDMLVTSMRAGYSFQAAMRFIGQEMPAPLGPEFARFYDEQRLGVEVRTALLAMQDRIRSLDFKMLATAVLIQRETGGSLGEVLTNIAELMRERVAVRGQIETLTSEPKLSARILAALPVVAYFGLWLVNREYVAPLTTESVGRVILGVAALAALIGYWILMQIADVDY